MALSRSQTAPPPGSKHHQKSTSSRSNQRDRSGSNLSTCSGGGGTSNQRDRSGSNLSTGSGGGGAPSDHTPVASAMSLQSPASENGSSSYGGGVSSSSTQQFSAASILNQLDVDMRGDGAAGLDTAFKQYYPALKAAVISSINELNDEVTTLIRDTCLFLYFIAIFALLF